jgi:hypothetical protein
MSGRQRTRLFGSGILILLTGTLALAACNSSPGSSQKTPGAGNTVTGAESPTSAKAPAKGSLAEAVAEKLKGLQ